MNTDMMRVRILHLDDNEDDRIIARHHFSRLSDSVEILWAEDAEEARELVQDNAVDCIISDLQMPKEDGLAFLQSLRQASVNTPFILLTGHGSEEIASRAFELGANDYFSKISGAAAYERVLHSVFNLVSADRSRQESREVESKYRQFFSDNVSGAFEILDDGTILNANDSFYTILGFTSHEVRSKLRFSGLFEKPAMWQRFVGSLRLDGNFAKQHVRLVNRKLEPFEAVIQARRSSGGNSFLGTLREAKNLAYRDTNGDEIKFSLEHFISNTALPIWYFLLDQPVHCEASETKKLKAVDEALLTECNEAFVRFIGKGRKSDLLGKHFKNVFGDIRFSEMRKEIIDFGKSNDTWRQSPTGEGPIYFTLYSVRRDNLCLGYWGTILVQ